MEQILSFEAESLVILPNATKLLVHYCTSQRNKTAIIPRVFSIRKTLGMAELPVNLSHFVM